MLNIFKKKVEKEEIPEDKKDINTDNLKPLLTKWLLKNSVTSESEYNIRSFIDFVESSQTIIDGNIIVKIVRSSNVAKKQREIEQEAEKEASICPECGRQQPVECIPQKLTYVDRNLLTNICSNCGCEWNVTYTRL